MSEANTPHVAAANTAVPKANTPPAPPPPKPPVKVDPQRDYLLRNMDKDSPNRNPDGSYKVTYPIVQKDGKH